MALRLAFLSSFTFFLMATAFGAEALTPPKECSHLEKTEIFSRLIKISSEINSSRVELSRLFEINTRLCNTATVYLTESRNLSELQTNAYEVARVGDKLDELEEEFIRNARYGAEGARMLGENACYEALQSQKVEVETRSTIQKKQNQLMRQLRCR